MGKIYVLIGVDDDDSPVVIGSFVKEKDAIDAFAHEIARSDSKYTGVTYVETVPE